MSLKNKFHIIIPPQDISSNPGCLRSLGDGDREAFAWLYKNYCRKVYDYALLMTGSSDQSDDIVQDLFERLWTKRQNLKEVENFNSYFNSMMRNTVADIFEQQVKEKIILKEYIYLSDESVEQKDEQAAYCNEKEQLLQKAVEQLPAQQKLVYKLQRQEGFKRKEIAQKLQLSPSTIKTHIQQGLKFIRQHLKT